MKRALHRPDLSLLSDMDWARIAAYIDGEGHVGIVHQVHKPPHAGIGRYGYCHVVVSNTDARLIEWLLEKLGGNVQVRKTHSGATGRRQRWKPCFNWLTSNKRAAEVLKHCLPYFLIKREQAELAIAYQSLVRMWGVKGTPAEVVKQKEELRLKLRAMTARGPLQAVNE